MARKLIELNEFIETALEQIVHGVNDAAVGLSEYGAVLNPYVKGKAEDIAPAGVISSLDPLGEETKDGKPRKVVVRVRFDIAVAVEGEKGHDVKLGVLGSLTGFGVGSRFRTKRSAEHRIQFEVPLRLKSYAPNDQKDLPEK